MINKREVRKNADRSTLKENYREIFSKEMGKVLLNRLHIGSGEFSSFETICSNWRGVMVRSAAECVKAHYRTRTLSVDEFN